MKAVQVIKYGRFPQLVELPIPKLEKDKFLIKMKYAPINPSDINFFQGFYGIRKEGTPIVGFEGSGTILQAQNSKYNNLVGKSVSVLANKSNGTFATHLVSSAEQMIIWPNQGKFQEQNIRNLSMAWINPVSCIGLGNYIPKHNFQTVIISAATSQLSKILIRYIKKKHPSVKLIGFSRSDTQDSQLIKLGLNQVHRLNSHEIIEKLKQKQGKTLFLDCIGGEFASKMFNSLPPHSLLVSYGRLSRQPLNNIDLGQLYFKDKKIQGFWMNTFLKQITLDQLNKVKDDIVENHDNVFFQNIRKQYPLQNFMDAIRDSTKNASEGKILLKM